MRSFIFRTRPWRWPGLLLALVFVPFYAPAPETDNFYLPLEPDFADLGDLLETLHTRAIEEGVSHINNRIEHALKLKSGGAEPQPNGD